MNYKESLSYLESLNVFGSKLGLSRIERLVELLGHPETRYGTVHVTGTNGKGSVSAMTAAILSRSGLRTGLYTSPHLTSYTERFVIDGEQASEEDFAAAVSAARRAADTMLAEGEEQPTEFEVLTAAAFWHFAEKQVNYAVIEVGLGGLLDSTNVITPEVAVITNVALEHADRCGGTLEGVASHKAGIIKKDMPVVTAAEGMALDILRRKAEEEGADLFVLGEDFTVRAAEREAGLSAMDFCSELLGIRAVRCALSLDGAYQRQNAALAFMAAKLLVKANPSITEETITAALRSVTWPGRFERFALEGTAVIVDGRCGGTQGKPGRRVPRRGARAAPGHPRGQGLYRDAGYARAPGRPRRCDGARVFARGRSRRSRARRARNHGGGRDRARRAGSALARPRLGGRGTHPLRGRLPVPHRRPAPPALGEGGAP